MANASELYYSYTRCLSFQRFLNIITGGRGIGKTYGIQKQLIKDFKKDGSQFIWLRRYRSELKVAKDGFFNKVQVEFPEDKLEIRGNSAYINGELAGVFCALSTGSTNKGNSKLSKPKKCVFDEYIIKTKTGHQRYLNDEMRVLFDFLETFFRTNEKVQVFMLSNNISESNPLYAYFNINLDKGQKLWIDTDVYCEICETSEELKKLKDSTPIAKITKKYDKDYYNYNVNNEVLDDSTMFIKLKDKLSTQIMTILFTDQNVYIYRSRDDNGRRLYFACEKGQDLHRLNYTFDLDKVNEKVMFIDKKEDSSGPIKELANAYKRGCLYFENQTIKTIMTSELRKFF